MCAQTRLARINSTTPCVAAVNTKITKAPAPKECVVEETAMHTELQNVWEGLWQKWEMDTGETEQQDPWTLARRVMENFVEDSTSTVGVES